MDSLIVFGAIFFGVVVILASYWITWTAAYYYGREAGLEEGMEVGERMEKLKESHRRIHEEALWYVNMN